MLLPANFTFPVFAVLLLLNGVGMGLFAAPNTTGIMNSVPASQRGAGSGMRATFQNSGAVLSIGVFFTLMILGLSASLPHSMSTGLVANGVAPVRAQQIAKLPPVGSLFSAFLGYNPMQKLLGSQAKAGVTAAQWHTLTGESFFPHLISSPFMSGLRIALTASLIMCIIAAAASWLRGAKYVHEEERAGTLAVPVEADRLVGVDGIAVEDGGDLTANTMLALEDTARPNWVPAIVARVRKRL
jgi:hypothetical protein